MAKPCPVTRQQFLDAAGTAEVYLMVNGVRFDLDIRDVADPKESLGWTFNDRADVKVGDATAPAMLQAHVTLIGSKIERKQK